MTQWQVHQPLTLHINGLTCGRGGMALVKGLTLSLPHGKGLLLRGANGAGKSTLLLTLAGMMSPMAGTIVLEGHDPDNGPVVHYCGHRNAVRPRLTVFQTLDFWAAANGRTGMDPMAALDRVGLGAQAKLDAGYLSAGQQRRLALARLLVSARPLWLLDEPSAALDAEGQALLDTLLADHLAANGLAVVATHETGIVPGFSELTLGSAP